MGNTKVCDEEMFVHDYSEPRNCADKILYVSLKSIS